MHMNKKKNFDEAKKKKERDRVASCSDTFCACLSVIMSHIYNYIYMNVKCFNNGRLFVICSRAIE